VVAVLAAAVRGGAGERQGTSHPSDKDLSPGTPAGDKGAREQGDKGTRGRGDRGTRERENEGARCRQSFGIMGSYPQGLKPQCLCGLYGTAKAVPFQSRSLATGSKS
jgi:hypothetical protein